MDQSLLQKILFVQALEEADPEGRHLPLSTRHHATQQARERQLADLNEQSDAEKTILFLRDRTEIMLGYGNKIVPALNSVPNRLQITISPIPIAILTLICGLFVNGLGESQRVNLLNFPLLFLLLWNIGIYLSVMLMPLFHLCLPSSTFTLNPMTQYLAQWAGTWRPYSQITTLPSQPQTGAWVQEAVNRFTTRWWQLMQPVWTNRLRQLLHLGAAGLALGMVLGMYVRGLALDYQATWESTFLSAEQVQTILKGILGPAAWLLHYPFPTLSEIMELQAPKHGPAAFWVHLWALTTLVVIVGPRLLFAWIGQRRFRQAGKTFALPLKDPYFLRLLAPDRGQGVQVDVFPYSYHPSPESKTFVETRFLDLLGNLAHVHWHEPLSFGQDFAPPRERVTAPHASPLSILALMFHAGQTPELEVHGELLHTIQAYLAPDRSSSKILVLLDLEPYRRVVDQGRLIEREHTWQQFGGQYHIQIVPFDVSSTTSDAFIQQAQAGIWPPSP